MTAGKNIADQQSWERDVNELAEKVTAEDWEETYQAWVETVSDRVFSLNLAENREDDSDVTIELMVETLLVAIGTDFDNVMEYEHQVNQRNSDIAGWGLMLAKYQDKVIENLKKQLAEQ
ncbi:hypothetical protein [Nesterenkonia alba]|uniref:hypothetical protein n=1 Tax=Nesterenkonia alba TaxID=515814 RepID=UPI0003B6558C|nr:hypothetical protein [Nesterenkonia alba]